MSDAFACLDGLTAADFASPAPEPYAADGPEVVAYEDILGDLATPLGDADGVGAVDDPGAMLTTADVTKEVLAQEVAPSLSMDEVVAAALREAAETAAELDAPAELAPAASDDPGRAEDVARATAELLEDDDLKREIEGIFDRAGEQLTSELESVRREQAALSEESSRARREALDEQRQRLDAAEQSAARMIRTVAERTGDVQRAMDDLAAARDDAAGRAGGGPVEGLLLELKAGGPAKQAALIGGLLFGSRGLTEAILAVASPYGEEHFFPALVQSLVALACAAYFVFAKK